MLKHITFQVGCPNKSVQTQVTWFEFVFDDLEIQKNFDNEKLGYKIRY